MELLGERDYCVLNGNTKKVGEAKFTFIGKQDSSVFVVRNGQW